MGISRKFAKMHPLVKKAVFAAGTLLGCLVILEAVMIIAEPFLFHGFYQYDPDLGFKVRAYASGTNRFGFNDRDYELQKPVDVYRILVVGDSFNWAGGRENNYTEILEREFDHHYGAHRVDIINAGYPMTHTGEQFAMLKKYGLQYDPDLVVIGFFAGNDFIDADPHRKRIVVNDTYFDIDRRFEITIMGYPIVFKSRLWQFIKQRLTVWKSLDTAHAQDSSQSRNADMFDENVFLEIEKYRMGFCHLPSQEQGVYRKNIDYILETLRQMKSFLDARDTGLAVAIYPDEFQVNDDLLSQIIRTYNLNKEDYDIALMQHLLKKQLDAMGVDCLDLLDEFKRKGEEEPLYLTRNTHWNLAGNKLAADVLFRFLLPRVDPILPPE